MTNNLESNITDQSWKLIKEITLISGDILLAGGLGAIALYHLANNEYKPAMMMASFAICAGISGTSRVDRINELREYN